MPSTERTDHDNSRWIASRIVLQWRQHGDMPARLLEAESNHRAFVMEMVMGVVRNLDALEWMTGRLAKRPPTDDLQAILCVGLYQLLMMDHVEPYAAVHETVEAAKLLCGESKASFVNAILRRAQREGDTLRKALKKQPPHIQYSHPKPLIDRWTKQFGLEDTIRLCQWNNSRPDITLRVRPPISRDEFLQALAEEGVAAQPHPTRSDFVILAVGAHIEPCPGYAQGWFMVQDPATMGAVDLLAPQPGEHILDACAAPGGKTIAIADRLAGTGRLMAGDCNSARLERVRENLARCNLADRVEIQVMDATEIATASLGGTVFDAVLLDVPCSNTGVIRRRPDARRRISTAHLDQLLTLQARILDQAAALVKPGGRIVYSTCSLEREENEDQVAAWLKRHTQFTLRAEHRSFPPRDQMDGAYAACLQLSVEA